MKAAARPFVLIIVAAGVVAGAAASAQGIRDRTRPENFTRESLVNETQAADITLTVAPVAPQLLQTWIRAAGILDDARHALRACVPAADAALLATGQRVRVFSPESKSSVYQARISAVTSGQPCAIVEAALSGPVYGEATRYVMEIIVDRGMLLAVPNAAIIERDGKQLVYVQLHPGHYDPREVTTGLRGETYTEVISGLTQGSEVITIGSFFVDAEYRLTMTPGSGMGAHHHH